MMNRYFRAHGEFCASHPWEVIVATLTLTTCLLTVENHNPAPPSKPAVRYCPGCIPEAEYIAADVVVMTLIRCLAVLYSYYQFCNLHKLGSKYILGIAGLFTVFSSFVFTSTVLNFLRIDVSDLKDALFFFLLLIDLSKAAILAQFALSAVNHEEVKNNIARGLAVLGPTITLDTIVETLVIGVGTLSGVQRLEILSWIACLSVLVNYIIFMTFYPACLSLILELSRTTGIYGKQTVKQCIISRALNEEDQKSNPVVQRVKLIMSVGLMVVHVHSRCLLKESSVQKIGPFLGEQHIALNTTEYNTLQSYVMKWIALSADHIVILILLLALVAKFVFFENKEELKQELLEHLVETQINRKNNHILNVDNGKTLDNHHTFYVDSSDCLQLNGDYKESEDKEIQTDYSDQTVNSISDESLSSTPRDLATCLKIYNSNLGANELTDTEVISLVKNKHIPSYQIEKAVSDPARGVRIRRQIVGDEANIASALLDLPYQNYDYSKVMGACCENVIGYVPVPVGIVGPMRLDGKIIHVPMATTEGCLVASTNRGSRALLRYGIVSRIVADGMTRGPVVRFPSVDEASKAMRWMNTAENFAVIKDSFDQTSRFARLTRIHVRIAGRYLFIRYVATTGDAMGMNMLSKGTEMSLKFLMNYFPQMEILSLSGNICTDKKPAAVNWIEGRGKSVVCEAVVPADVIHSVLKTNVQAMVDVNISKNMIGSAMAGSIGGFNAHAANLVTAIYIATGQDPAQNVGSSNCITLMEPWGEHGEDLYISCTMPSIEIGTVGGGTVLPAQASCLEMLGVRGPHPDVPGENANQLAKVICGTVLAGELSLMAALAAGHLVKSHLRHNRSTTTMLGVVNMNSNSNSPCKDTF